MDFLYTDLKYIVEEECKEKIHVHPTLSSQLFDLLFRFPGLQTMYWVVINCIGEERNRDFGFDWHRSQLLEGPGLHFMRLWNGRIIGLRRMSKSSPPHGRIVLSESRLKFCSPGLADHVSDYDSEGKTEEEFAPEEEGSEETEIELDGSESDEKETRVRY